MNKHVLILSEAVGAGHTKAAEAIQQGIALLAPSVDTRVLELGRELHPIAAGLICHVYLEMITRYPGLWRKVYDRGQARPMAVWEQACIHKMMHRTVKSIVARSHPDLVVCTHPFSSSSVARLKRAGLPLRLCTVITDFHGHGAWVQPEVDRYLVPSEEVGSQLQEMGVPDTKIRITGLPLPVQFRVKHNKREMRRKLGLAEMPTVLVMGGSLGLGGIEEVARILAKWRDSLQIVLCAGHNDSLRQALCAAFQHPHIHVLGFVDGISQWMDAADWLITKPGGMTCAEALAKRLPLFMYQPLPGHEESNCAFLTRHKLAVRMDTEPEVDRWVQTLLRYPYELSRLVRNMERCKQTADPLAPARSALDFLMAEDGEARKERRLWRQ
ncbi:galactosyldiacylglycerol synthase [Aneurinibacillus sp. BA2021]|nr:galactosyldiacylglycerol synthase [Aneurinibacillus sp. BA2021]